jgi:hypothetical protein
MRQKMIMNAQLNVVFLAMLWDLWCMDLESHLCWVFDSVVYSCVSWLFCLRFPSRRFCVWDFIASTKLSTKLILNVKLSIHYKKLYPNLQPRNLWLQVLNDYMYDFSHKLLFRILCIKHYSWHTPTFLESFKCKSESENNGRTRSWGTLPNL